MAQNPELALWRNVLLVGLRDDDAGKWIKTPDFEAVASLAQLDPDGVRKAWLAGRVAPATRAKTGRAA